MAVFFVVFDVHVMEDGPILIQIQVLLGIGDRERHHAQSSHAERGLEVVEESRIDRAPVSLRVGTGSVGVSLGAVNVERESDVFVLGVDFELLEMGVAPGGPFTVRLSWKERTSMLNSRSLQNASLPKSRTASV